MGLIDSCEEYFGTKNLYEVLGVTNSSNERQIKKGYHKLSLKVHPDRASEDQKARATCKFQILGKVYFILSDKEKRSVYDDKGEVDDENDNLENKDWDDYWRLVFPKITPEDISAFERKYKGSDEEKEDLVKLYERFEGDFNQIADNLSFYSVVEEPRLRDILNSLIASEEIQSFKNFSEEPSSKKKKRQKKYEQEAVEAEQYKKELGCGESDSLKAMIAQKNKSREQSFSNLMSHLEDKYCKPKRKSSTKSKK